jgi:surface-anchored protein
VRLKRKLLAAVGIAAAIMVGTAGTASAEPISTGHVDVIDIDYASGALTVQALVNGVERDPATVELVVLNGAKTTVPNSAAYSFLGAPGDPVWILPQTQNTNLLWPGWNSTDVPSGVFGSNTLQMSLIGVTGGELAIYTTSLGNPTVLFDNGNGLPDTRPLATGAHAHANWAFSNAGTYTVTFQITGTLTNGTTISDDATYTFTVQA